MEISKKLSAIGSFYHNFESKTGYFENSVHWMDIVLWQKLDITSNFYGQMGYFTQFLDPNQPNQIYWNQHWPNFLDVDEILHDDKVYGTLSSCKISLSSKKLRQKWGIWNFQKSDFMGKGFLVPILLPSECNCASWDLLNKFFEDFG